MILSGDPTKLKRRRNSKFHEVHQAAYQYWTYDRKISAPSLRAYLALRFPCLGHEPGNTKCEEGKEVEIPKERAIRDWIYDVFPDLWKRYGYLDAPFNMDKAESLGITAIELPYINELLWHYLSKVLKMNDRAPARPFPSCRRVLWWAYVVRRADNMIPDDIFAIAATLEWRHFQSDIGAEDLDTEDIDAVLIAKPWLSDERASQYEEMVSRGYFPKLKRTKRDPQAFMQSINEMIARNE